LITHPFKTGTLCAEIPPAKLETVTPVFHELATTIEDEVLSEVETRRQESNAGPSSPHGAHTGNSGDLLGDLSTLNVDGRSGALPLPSIDSQAIAVDLHKSLQAGSETAIRLALAKYDAEDEEQIKAFCEHFDQCKEVASEASDLEIAAALFATEGRTGEWRQEAMHVLMC
jgi:hypothetical protein